MKKLLLSLGVLTMGSVFYAQQAPGWDGYATDAPGLHYPYAMSVVNDNVVWFADHALTSATDKSKLTTLSTNGGLTWTSKAIVGPAVSSTVGDFVAVSANTAWMISSGSGAQNGVWKTTDSGTSWTKQTTAAFGGNSESFANIVYFWDENEGFSAGDPTTANGGRFEIYRTVNGGTNWTKLNTAPLADGDFGYTHLRWVLGNNVWMGTDVGNILYSPDKGVTWQRFVSPALDFGGVTVAGSFAQLAFKDASNGLLLTNDTGAVGLYRTSDSGANWEPIDPIGNFYGGDIAHVPGTVNTYVSSSGDGASYSLDGGENWVDMEFPAGEAPYGGTIQFTSPTIGYMGGMSQAAIDGIPVSAMYKFRGQFLAVSDVNASKAKLTIANNPVGDKVELKSTKEIVTATVIDMAGKAIKRENAASFNVSNLSKGTYIIQVQYKDGSFENTKMIKK